jgi:hypothetical protein
MERPVLVLAFEKGIEKLLIRRAHSCMPLLLFFPSACLRREIEGHKKVTMTLEKSSVENILYKPSKSPIVEKISLY